MKKLEKAMKKMVRKKYLGKINKIKKVNKKIEKKHPKKVFRKHKEIKTYGASLRKITKILPETNKKERKKINKSGLSRRASTGIPIFDKMIRGGYDRGSINLVAGGTGSGKTIFALQFLIDGLKKEEKVLYVTFEEKKGEFYENMRQFGWDLDKLERAGNFVFLEYSPEKVKMMLDEGGGSIESIVLKKNIKRMVIDSITSFSLLFETELEKRQATLGLFDIIRKWNVTTMLTVQNDNEDKANNGLSSIEFEVDSITLLYYFNIKGERKRFIEVIKMRGTNHSDEIRSFEIKKGIKIGKKSSIKGLIR